MFHNFLTLLVENLSSSLTTLLENHHYLFELVDIQHVIAELASMPQKGNHKQQCLKDVMDSRAFKTVYYQNVCSTGYESYK